jgi:macrolide transport system ATP-binding/permease protein
MTPRLAAISLKLFVPHSAYEQLAGDLEELFLARLERDGPRSARQWYVRQVWRSIVETNLRRRARREHARGDSAMQTIVQDIRYGIRMLRKQPGFTATAVLMLALGIGANATVFSWVNAVLLNPMPGASHPEEIVQPSYLFRGSPLTSFSYPDYRDMRDSVRSFSGVAARDDLPVGIVIDREAERAWAEIVTSNYFDVLGVRTWRGRGLQGSDDVPGAPGVVVISYDYWVSRFAGTEQVIGRQVQINAQPFTIVGVAQPGFFGGASALQFDMWVPVGTQPQVSPAGNRLEARGSRWLSVLARRHPGATVDQARADLGAFVVRLAAAYPGYTDTTGTIYTLMDSPANGGISVLRPVLLVLMTVAAIVLLIACANLAGLLLARAAARQREMAIRLSVGAGRMRIVQQLLIEASMLALMGTGAALLALRWTSRLLLGFAPPSELPIHLDVAVDAPVVVFTASVAFATLILFALVPALQATLADLAGNLRDAGSAARGSSRNRLRRSLVAAQVALSTILLVGAGLCVRSLSVAQTMTPGFDPNNVVIGWLDLIPGNYTGESARPFYARVLERVRAIPGVESASLARRIPLGFTGTNSSSVTVEGTSIGNDEPRFVNVNYVGPTYLQTMKIGLVSGRDFSADDVAGQPPVAIVTEAFAHVYWPGIDAVGRRLVFGRLQTAETRWITVVGVAKDIKQRTMTERPQPAVWLPALQSAQTSVVLHVRAAGSPVPVLAELPKAIREVDSNVTFYNVSLLADHVKAATFQQRMAANLLMVFGGLALLLAAVGSYGVLSYLVGQRRREIGIRLAVGATRRSVFTLIVSSGAKVIGAGAVIGLLLSIGAGLGLRGLLIGVQPVDPVTYASVTGLLFAVALMACALPARRAAALDPALTLRDE